MANTPKRVTVTKQFVDNFEKVAECYNLKELGEYDLAKEAARRDIESADVCFASIAGED